MPAADPSSIPLASAPSMERSLCPASSPPIASPLPSLGRAAAAAIAGAGPSRIFFFFSCAWSSGLASRLFGAAVRPDRVGKRAECEPAPSLPPRALSPSRHNVLPRRCCSTIKESGTGKSMLQLRRRAPRRLHKHDEYKLALARRRWLACVRKKLWLPMCISCKTPNGAQQPIDRLYSNAPWCTTSVSFPIPFSQLPLIRPRPVRAAASTRTGAPCPSNNSHTYTDGPPVAVAARASTTTSSCTSMFSQCLPRYPLGYQAPSSSSRGSTRTKISSSRPSRKLPTSRPMPTGSALSHVSISLHTCASLYTSLRSFS